MNLYCLFRERGRSGPRMLTWFRIPLLTKIFLLSLETCRFSGSQTFSRFPLRSNENILILFKDEGNRIEQHIESSLLSKIFQILSVFSDFTSLFPLLISYGH